MTSIGDRLRRERMRQSLELDQVAKKLQINTKLLEAIEEGDKPQIPGGFFYRSFVRQYAGILGLDSGEIEEELGRLKEAEKPLQLPGQEDRHAEYDLPPLPIRSRRWSISARRAVLALLLFVGVVLGCAGLYSLWQRFRQAPEPVVQQLPTTAGRDVARLSDDSAVPPEAVEPKVVPSLADSGSVSAPVSPSQHDPATNMSEGAKLQVDVTATETTWVSASSDGMVRFSEVLKAGDSRKLSASERVVLKIGNAGGLKVWWNGQAVGPIGAQSEVRTLEFTAEGFRIRPSGQPSTQSP